MYMLSFSIFFLGLLDSHSPLSLTRYRTYHGDIKTHVLLPNQCVDMRISELNSNYNVFVQLSGLVKKNESFILMPTNQNNVFVPNFENSSLRSILEMWKCNVSRFEFKEEWLRIYLRIAFFKERAIQLNSSMGELF